MYQADFGQARSAVEWRGTQELVVPWGPRYLCKRVKRELWLPSQGAAGQPGGSEQAPLCLTTVNSEPGKGAGFLTKGTELLRPRSQRQVYPGPAAWREGSEAQIRDRSA